MRLLRQLLRVAITLVLLVVAADLVAALWHHYVMAPWTRDGRVRVETVAIAPEISGPVTEIKVSDNQRVGQGDVLYIIDPERFAIALAQAEAISESRRQDLRLAQARSERRARLNDLSASSEEKEQYSAIAAVAAANYAESLAQVRLARLNLAKTVIRSPVAGYVTNLRLRVGDYVDAGKTSVVVVDQDSFWIAAYFEETKLSQIKVGAPVFIQLMGFDRPLKGHVEALTRGISDQNGEAGSGGLVSVNPVFTWVRLAQRIPVHVHIDQTPPGIEIAAGMTCTVNLDTPEDIRSDAGFLLHWLRANLF